MAGQEAGCRVRCLTMQGLHRLPCASQLKATDRSYWKMNDLNKPRAEVVEVGEESAAQRIDNFLLRRLKGVPKSHVYRVLRSGEVRVNSGRVGPDACAGNRTRNGTVLLAGYFVSIALGKLTVYSVYAAV